MQRIILIAVLIFAAAAAVFFWTGRHISSKPGSQESVDVKSDRLIMYKYSWGEIIEQEAGLVEKELESRLRASCPVDLEAVVIDGTDYGLTIDIDLASGEPIDAFLIPGNQLGYWYRRGGVITPLNDLIDRCGPALKRGIPERLWAQVTVAGKILSIPGYTDARGSCIVVRQDILDRYHLPLPRSIEELERTSARLMELDPAIIPITGAWWDFGPLLCPALGIEHWDAHIVDDERQLIYTGNKALEFYRFFQTLRRWRDRGYLDGEFLSSNFERMKEMFFAGKNVFTFNHVERTNDWARELAAVDPGAKLSVIPELNNAGVWSPLGEIPHHLVIPQQSVNKEKVIQYVNWIFQSTRNYHLAHLGIEGRHYRRQAYSFVPLEPVRYRGVFTPVVNKDFALPNASMYPSWYPAIEEIQKVRWKTDPLNGKVFLDTSIERDFPDLDRFDQEWWKYLDGRLEPTRDSYARTVSLYFQNGGEEVSRAYYRQYVDSISMPDDR